MTDVKDSVDWKNKKEIWARLPLAKSAVTRACTAIDKLIDHQYTLSTPTEADEARKCRNEALNFCVELHDPCSDLELLDSNESASETAEKSLKPYEEKQFAALEKLTQYISEQGKTKSVSTAETPDPTNTIPKLATCKLLFPEKLTKSKTPCEFRLWIAAFQRFHDASGLKQQSVATQQGYLLQALDADLQDIVARQFTPSMPIFGQPDASISSRRNSDLYTRFSLGVWISSRSGEIKGNMRRTFGDASLN